MAKLNHSSDWERAVILELIAEHQYACHIHKVKLQSIHIKLFDSETKWGQFDSSTKTISISRKLVNEHPWHVVVGIFRHEMAHQLVAEESKSDERPHGEAFQAACRRLGVPEFYTRAGVDLRSAVFDWRQEARDPKTEAILNKVRGLLALAGSTNEHEALLAMRKVQELYAKYNLHAAEEMAGQNFVHAVLTHKKKGLPQWFLLIASLLSTHFFVRTLTLRQYDVASGQKHGAIEVIGRRENVMMAEYVFNFLLFQLDELVKQRAASPEGLGRRDRNSYRLGILHGFAKKLETTKAPHSVASEKTTAATSRELSIVDQALMRFKKDKALDQYIKMLYPKLSYQSLKSKNISRGAFAAGEEAGAKITLNKPIEERSQGRTLLLK